MRPAAASLIILKSYFVTSVEFTNPMNVSPGALQSPAFLFGVYPWSEGCAAIHVVALVRDFDKVEGAWFNADVEGVSAALWLPAQVHRPAVEVACKAKGGVA